MQIKNYEGRGLEIDVPEFTFQQLTDNREWNWSIFNWRAHTPLTPDRKELAFAIRLTAAAKTAQPLVDQFGQSTREDWPGKVKSLDELKGDAASEQEWYESLHPPELDRSAVFPAAAKNSGSRRRVSSTWGRKAGAGCS